MEAGDAEDVGAEEGFVRREVGDSDPGEVVRGAEEAAEFGDFVEGGEGSFEAVDGFGVLGFGGEVEQDLELLLGRRTILGVGLGTTCYVVLVNAF